MTRAERTDYKETSRHADVQEFIRSLAPKTNLIQIDTLGTSALGQDIPILVVSGSRIFSPEGCHRTGKTVVMVLANIHAGEVEGKEACLMLARDLTLGRGPDFMKDVVLVLIPDYNPDGNDRIDVKNRALDLKKFEGQIGPEGGVGTRYNGEEINLNRDYMKIEAVESRLLSHLYGRWRPHVFIDCHTTDGSIHGYHLTFDTAHNIESSPRAPIQYARDVMLPEIARRLEKRTGYSTFFYGNWRDNDDPSKGWETYPALPRYGSHYRGLTGRMDVLLEAYSYIGFKTRVDVMYETLMEIFAYVGENGEHIRNVVEIASRDTVDKGRSPQPDDRIGINYGVPSRDEQGRLLFTYPAYPFPESVEVMGWDLPSQRSRALPGKKRVKYQTLYYARFVPEISARRPFAYVFPGKRREVLGQLHLHNILVDQLAEDVVVPCEVQHILARESTVSPDVGGNERFETVFWTRTERRSMKLRRGDHVVLTAQTFAHVAIYLLEALSDDGLVRWNFFDDLKSGDRYPVLRILDPVELPLR